MQNPKISIIIPILNAKDYIKECLESVLNQSLKDIEILCVDANSTDGTLEILKVYAQKDTRLKLIISDKKSMGYQYNLGLKEARGEFVGFVESDDFCKPQMYERLLEVALNTNAQVVRSDILEFKQGKKERKFNYKNICEDEKFYSQMLDASSLPELLVKTWNMNQSSLHRLDFLRAHEIKFNETPGASYQDTGFFYQVQMLAKRMYLLKDAFYYYRCDNENSSVHDKTKVFAVCDEFEFIKHFLDKNEALKHEFNAAFVYKKFTTFLWNFKRIDRAYQSEFLTRFQKEFKDLEAQNRLDFKFFGEVRKRELILLLLSKEQFYQRYLEGLSFMGMAKKMIYRQFRRLKGAFRAG